MKLMTRSTPFGTNATLSEDGGVFETVLGFGITCENAGVDRTNMTKLAGKTRLRMFRIQ